MVKKNKKETVQKKKKKKKKYPECMYQDSGGPFEYVFHAEYDFVVRFPLARHISRY